MAGMSAERKRSQIGVLLVGLAALIGLPIFLITIAVLEETVVGTSNITKVYRDVGIFGPLDWLLDNTVGRFL
jgi:hypothetical protein